MTRPARSPRSARSSARRSISTRCASPRFQASPPRVAPEAARRRFRGVATTAHRHRARPERSASTIPTTSTRCRRRRRARAVRRSTDARCRRRSTAFIGGGFPEDCCAELEGQRARCAEINRARSRPAAGVCRVRRADVPGAQHHLAGDGAHGRRHPGRRGDARAPGRPRLCPPGADRGDAVAPGAATKPGCASATEFHHSSLENLDPGVAFAYRRSSAGYGVDGRKHDGIVVPVRVLRPRPAQRRHAVGAALRRLPAPRAARRRISGARHPPRPDRPTDNPRHDDLKTTMTSARHSSRSTDAARHRLRGYGRCSGRLVARALARARRAALTGERTGR